MTASDCVQLVVAYFVCWYNDTFNVAQQQKERTCFRVKSVQVLTASLATHLTLKTVN